jgi:hypothetical protein
VSQQTARGVDFAADAEQLRQSMQARPNPDMAKGVLMVLYGSDGASAFAELLRVAEQECVLLTDLAAVLVHLVNTDAAALDRAEQRNRGDLDGDANADSRALAVALREWGPALARARAATRADRLSARPRGAQRMTGAAEYITDLLTPRSLVSRVTMLRPREQE